MKRFFAVLLCAVLLCAAGCSGKAAQDDAVALNVQEVYSAMEQAVQLPEMIELDADMMYSFCGIEASGVRQAKVVICADSLRTDEVWLVEAVDADAAQRIAELAGIRLEMKDAESVTYSPEQNAIVKKAELLQKGNFIALIVSPDVDAMAEVFRAAAGLQG